MQEEIWKSVPNYEDYYQVSNLGRVKSLSRFIFRPQGSYYTKEKILVNKLDGNNYHFVCLCVNDVRKYYKVYTLVAICFLNHKPNGKQDIVIDHIDNNKDNNKLSNLRLITQRENSSKNYKNKTSIYTGVSRTKNNKWRSSIMIKGKTINLGEYKCETLAHFKYLQKLKDI